MAAHPARGVQPEELLQQLAGCPGRRGGHDAAATLEWLETAMRLRDSGLLDLKTDPLLDPLRHEPRFQAIERALKFPD